MIAHAPSWSLIPEHMIEVVRHYIENGLEPGSFLSAVLQNDLRRAVECADEININRLPDYIRYTITPLTVPGALSKHSTLGSLTEV